MIKARVIAGDVPAGEEFLGNLRPFIWRKHLDFAAIQDIHSIKRQIHAVEGPSRDRGRRPQHQDRARRHPRDRVLRPDPATDLGRPQSRSAPAPDLRRDRAAGRRSAAPAARSADDLIAAYRYLRHVEHRLQMIDDQQTQTLPDERPGAGPPRPVLRPSRTRRSSARRCCIIWARSRITTPTCSRKRPSLGDQGNLVFTGTEDDPATVATLERMGFSGRQRRSPRWCAAWHHGRYRATRSARARELLTELMPKLLEALSQHRRSRHRVPPLRQLHAVAAGGRAAVLPALLQSRTAGSDRGVMGSAPLLADHLSRYPMLLDGVLTAGFFEKVPDRSAMSRDLHRQLVLRRRLPGPPQPDVPLDQGPAVPDRRPPAAGRRATATWRRASSPTSPTP